jgi:hypothetical protein
MPDYVTGFLPMKQADKHYKIQDKAEINSTRIPSPYSTFLTGIQALCSSLPSTFLHYTVEKNFLVSTI